MKLYKSKSLKLAAALAATLLSMNYLPNEAEAVYMLGPFWDADGGRLRGQELHFLNVGPFDVLKYDWNDSRGDAQFRMNINELIKVSNDPSFGNIWRFLFGEFVILDITDYKGIYHNGELYDFLGFVRVKADNLTISSNQYALTPLFYMDKNTTLWLTNGKNTMPGMASLLDLGYLRGQIQKLILDYPPLVISSSLKRMAFRQFEDNVTVKIEGGLLIQGLESRHTGAFDMSSGGWALFMQTADDNGGTIRATDKITGGTITNALFSSLYIEGGTVENYRKLGTTNIIDIPILSTGMTDIGRVDDSGKVLNKAYVDWQENYLTQGKLTINNGSGFKTANISNIRTSIINNGHLDIYGTSGKEYLNYSSISTDFFAEASVDDRLGIHTNITNMADITQKLIKIDAGVVFSNDAIIFAPTIVTNQLDNSGKVVLKNGTDMTIGKVGTIGRVELVNGSKLTALADVVSGDIDVSGDWGRSTMTMRNVGVFQGSINIGAPTNQPSILVFKNGTIAANSKVNIHEGSRLLLTNGAQLNLNNNDIYNGSIILDQGILNYDQVNQGNNAKIYVYEGALTIGNGTASSILKLKGDSIIDSGTGVKLSIQNNSKLILDSKDTIVNLDKGRGDVWNGQLLLNDGTLNLIGGTDSSKNIYSGVFNTQAGQLKLKPNSILQLNNGNNIDLNTKLTVAGKSEVKINQGATVAFNGGAENIADDNSGLIALNGGSLDVYNTTELVNNNGKYQQTAGELTLRDSNISIIDKNSFITGGSVSLINSTLDMQDDDVINKAKIYANNDSKTIINVNGRYLRSTLELLAGSYVKSIVTVGDNGALVLRDDSQLSMGKNSKWNGTIKITNADSRLSIDAAGVKSSTGVLIMDQGRLNVNKDFAISTQDQINSGQMSIGSNANLSNTGIINSKISNYGNILSSDLSTLKGTINTDTLVNYDSATIRQDTINIIAVGGIGGALQNNNKSDDAITANNMTIAKDSKLYATANSLDIKNGLTNNGTFYINGGSMDSNVSGTGAIKIQAQTIFNNNTVNQAKLDVDAGLTISNATQATISGITTNNSTLINNGMLDTTLSNNKVISGTGKLILHGNSYNGAQGTITQDSLAVKDGNFVNKNNTDKSISVGSLQIASNANLQTNANALYLTQDRYIANAGTLTLNGGTLSVSLVDDNGSKGKLHIDGKVNLAADSAVASDITVSRGNSLTVADAKDIQYGASNNLGTIILQSGTLASGVTIKDSEQSAHGNVVIDGIVTNQGHISQQVTINKDKTLYSDIGGLGSSIQNEGSLYLSGSLITTNNNISGMGNMFAQNDLVNNAHITQSNIYIADNKTLTNNANITATQGLSFSGTLNNQGTVTAVINNVSTITNNASGKGVLNIIGASQNAAYGNIIQQQVNIDVNASLKNDGQITAALHTAGKITGDGTITLSGNSYIGASVSNKLENLNSAQTLTVSGQNIVLSGEIINDGKLELNPYANGIEINANIDSSTIGNRGQITMNNSGRVELNATVSNQELSINNGTLVLGITGNLDGSNLTLGGALPGTNAGAGRLDLSSGDNGALRNVTLNDLTVNTDRAASGLLVDVNLNNSTNDKITVTGTASSGANGALNLHAVNIVQDFADGQNQTTLTLIDTAGGSIDSNFKINDATMASDSGRYQFTQNNTSLGRVEVSKIGSGITLLEAVQDKDITAYSMTKNDYTGALAALAGGTDRNLTIFGNNHTINGVGNRGLTVGIGQELLIKDAIITGYQATNSNDGYALTNNNLAYLEGVHFTDNKDTNGNKVDIFNSGELHFQSKDSSLDGGIQGTGDIYISGARLSVVEGSIKQSNLTISVTGGLSIAAGGLHITNGLTNNGVLSLQDGVLSQTITGDGNTYIAGNVDVFANGINIEQDIYVLDTGKLHTTLNNFTGNIVNDGRLVLDSGKLLNTQIIEGNGTLQVNGALSNHSSIRQGRIEIGVNNTLTNELGGVITVSKELINQGTLTNNSSVLAQLNNQAIIDGTGQLTVAGASENSGTIAQDDLIITEGILTNTNANVSAITAKNGITINNNAALITNADAVGSGVNNAGIYKLTGGTLKQLVDGIGSTVIAGDVTNNTSIKQAGVLVQTGALHNNLGSTIDAKVGVNEGAILNASVDDLLQTVYNDGTYNITAGVDIKQDILGGGNLNITQNMTNKADILQTTVNLNDSTIMDNQGRIQATINVNATATLNSTASSILGQVNNEGIYNIQGGLISYDIMGTGTVNILADTLNKATIKQQVLNITANNIFSSNASNVQNKISNEGTYQVTSGNIRYAITGDGSMQVIEGDVHNYANIEQKQVVISSKLTNEVGTQIKADELANVGTFVNDGQVITNLTNGGIISGKGSIDLHGESYNLANSSVTQGTINITADNELINYGQVTANKLTVNQGSLLYSNADGIAARVLNNGIYTVAGGTIAYDITTDSNNPNGQLYILDNAANIANIVQKDLLNNQDITFDNKGQITVSNLLQNDGTMLNSGITKGNVLNNANASLNNSGLLDVELSNLGIVTGSGSMLLHGVSVNQGMITQDKINLTADSWLVNSNDSTNSITANLITIENSAGLQANADSINAQVANNGTYDVQGGLIKQQISGNGSLNIWANTTNDSHITQGNIYLDADTIFTNNLGKTITANILYVSPADELDPESQTAATLIANASDIKSIVYNEGRYLAQGGVIGKEIAGQGKLYIQGIVTNDALVYQSAVTIEQGKVLTNNNAIVAVHLNNEQGVLNNNGDIITILDNQGTITGSGSLTLKGDKDNINTNNGVLTQKTIALLEGATLNNKGLISAQLVSVDNKAILNSSADYMVATVLNEGTYNLAGGTIYKPISGQGTLNLQEDTLNLNSVSQGLINIDSNVTIRNEGILQTPRMEELLALYAVDDIMGSKLDEVINKLTNATDGNLYSINNKGNIVSNGVILGSINNKGNITGRGILQLVGTSISAANVDINQSWITFRPYATLDFQNQSYRSLTANLISIEDEGSLTANAYAVGAPIINDGIYNIIGTANLPNVIDYDITTSTGRGQTNINVDNGARVVNDANIHQSFVDVNYGELYNNEGKKIIATVEISKDSDGKYATLTANASDIIGSIINRGVYNVQGAYDGGTIAFNVIGTKAKVNKAGNGEETYFANYLDENGIKQSINSYILKESDTVSRQRIVYTYTDASGQMQSKEIAYTVNKDANGNHSYVMADAPLTSLDSATFEGKLLALLPKDIDAKFEYVYDGVLNINSSTNVAAIVMQDKVNVAANVELTNNANIYANSLYNRGIVLNNAQIEAQLTNYGLIYGQGSILVKDGSNTFGNITNNITIDQDATFKVSGYAGISGHITNGNGSTLEIESNATGVILSGGISSLTQFDTAGNIIINKNGTVNNRLTIMGDVKNQNIELSYGTLAFINNNIMDNVNLSVSSGTLSLQNKSVSQVNLDSLTGLANAAKLDIDLGDTLAVKTTNGSMELGSVLVDTKLDYKDSVRLFNNQYIELTNTAKTYTNTMVYEISQDTSNKEYLRINKQAINEADKNNVLNLAINDLNNNRNNITLQVAGMLLQDKDVEDIGRWKKLTIAADMLSPEKDSIKGTNIKGIAVSGASDLIIKNLQEISGFSADSDSRNSGGFINNNGTTIITSEYTDLLLSIKNNYAREYGGAIANRSTSLYTAGIIYDSNTAGTGGGAISNSAMNGTTSYAKAELNYSTFSNNQAGYQANGAVNSNRNGAGGAIYNFTDSVDTYDYYSAITDVTGSTFKNNTATAMGGAIYNDRAANATGYAVIRVDNTLFQGNRATGEGASGIGQGGAIYNGAGSSSWSDYLVSAEDIKQDILTNKTNPSKFKPGDINISSAQFIGNSAQNDGGAIYNNNAGALNLTDTWLIDNTAEQGKGGAIYTKGNTVNITASTVNVDIHGNKANGVSNAIYMDCNNSNLPNGVLNLKAQNAKLLLLGDAVTIANASNPAVVNMNIKENNQDNNGKIILGKEYKIVKADGSFLDVEYTLENGSLYILSETNFSGAGNNNMTMTSGTTLSSINQYIGAINLNQLNIKGTDPYINLGVDLGANTVDQLIFNKNQSNIAANAVFNIAMVDVSLVPDNLRNSYGQLTDLEGVAGYALDGAINGKIFYGKIFDRKLTLSDDTLNFEFVRYNPSILASSVAAQGTYITQLNSYEQALDSVEPLLNLTADKRAQVKARAPREKTLWFKPYSSYEDMLLNNGPRAKSNIYGGFLGVDSPIQSYANGWEAVYSAYAGFNAMDNSYDGNKLKQNGVNVGASATFFKGNFHTALTANIGYNNATAETMYGSDHFHTTSFGIAAKAGYNIETGKFIIQPNLQVSYTNIGTANYTNVAGIAMSSSRMNAVQIAPGLKIMANLTNGWKPFVGIQRIWTHGGATSFEAMDVTLPSMSIKPYYQYNIGVQKDYGDKFSGGASLAMRNGGRKGLAFQANLRWMF